MSFPKLPDTEIHAVNEENGKIVAVMQANSQKELANRMELARDIDGVITVFVSLSSSRR